MAHWKCATCTFENVMARSICEMCMSARPPAEASASAAASAAAAPSASGWACPQCTYENVPAARTCAICAATRTEESAQAPPSLPDSAMQQELDEELIQNLRNLGNFSRDHVLKALAMTNNVSAAAAEWVLSHPEERPVAAASNIVSEDVVATTPNIIPQIDPEKAKRALAEAQRKEEERLARAAVLVEQKHRRVTEDIERIKHERIESKKLQEKKKKIERTETAKRRDAIERHNREQEIQRKNARLEQENQFKDIPSAVRGLKERYGMEGVKQTLSLIAKIVRNILRDPADERLRTLKTSSPFYRNRIRARLGAFMILRELGFRAVMRENELKEQEELLYIDTPDLTMLQAELIKMEALINQPESKVPSLLASASAESDAVLFLSMSLRRLLNNVIIAPHSSMAKKIDTRSDAFRAFFAPVPKSIEILRELGFSYEEPFWVIADPPMKRLGRALRDLQRFISQNSSSSSVVTSVDYIRAHNSSTVTNAVIEKLIDALSKVVADMHQTKNHRIDLSSLRTKSGGSVVGLKALCVALGLRTPVDDVSVVHIRYPYEHGIADYELRLDLLQHLWKSLSKSARRS